MGARKEHKVTKRSIKGQSKATTGRSPKKMLQSFSLSYLFVFLNN